MWWSTVGTYAEKFIIQNIWHSFKKCYELAQYKDKPKDSGRLLSLDALTGVAMPFSIEKRLGRGHTRRQIYNHAIKRLVILIIIGLLIDLWGQYKRFNNYC